MPADNKKLELRSLLAGKTTEELEELLALDFAEDKANLDAEYISTILEVIEERENSTEERNKDTLAAWNEFQAYRKEAESQELLEAGKSEEPTHDHRRIIEYRQNSRKCGSAWRMGIVAAVLAVILCSTAFGWSVFKVIAEWTEDVFFFLTGLETSETLTSENFEHLRTHVSELTDVPVVPYFAPEGTKEYGSLAVTEQHTRTILGMGYVVDNRQFYIRIFVYNHYPEAYSGKYQKDTDINEEYTVGGITHYITGNLGNLNAVWINGCVEGYIQGDLTLDEMRQMIDSIYEE